jgi:hypothetical protein
MTIADEMGFDQTSGDAAVTFCCDITSSRRTGNWVTDEGDDVGLKLNDKPIYLRDVVMNPEGYMTAEIRGFGYNSGVKFEGLALGQLITFRHVHVFGLLAGD